MGAFSYERGIPVSALKRPYGLMPLDAPISIMSGETIGVTPPPLRTLLNVTKPPDIQWGNVTKSS